jgi:hypothetical protein
VLIALASPASFEAHHYKDIVSSVQGVMKRKAAKGCNLVAIMAIGSNPRLQRFGNLLLDPHKVVAVMPICGTDDTTAVYGFRLITEGGELAVTDRNSVDAVQSYFYKPDHISPVFDPPPVLALQSSVV